MTIRRLGLRKRLKRILPVPRPKAKASSNAERATTAFSQPASELERIYSAHASLPSDINEHMSVLRRYASQCAHVTEIGVRNVVSTWAFLAARPRRLVCCDINRSPNVDSVERIAKENNIEFRFILGNDLEIDIEDTDLLFLDTLHTYEQLRLELSRHAARARRWIILHDTATFALAGEDGRSPGLLAALDELILTGLWQVTGCFKNNNGLTVVERR